MSEIERSLLQKAVRRGDVELAGKVIKYLSSEGDDAWLKRRLYVMTYEECWTFTPTSKIYESYAALAQTVKNKNAAGLAALAMRYNDGDRRVLMGNDQDIIDVGDAIRNPVAFWQSRPNTKEQTDIKKASFEGDKAMMIAAAYLSSRYTIPETVSLPPSNDPNFPYWIAIDKHTTAGKNVYREACEELSIDGYIGMQIGFYFEGAVCNQLAPSTFWEQQKFLELQRHGFTLEAAQDVWTRLRPLIIQKTERETASLIRKINKPDDQLPLF